MEVAIAIHPFGRSGGAERLAIMHAIGLARRGYSVKFYTDTTTLDPNWVRLLRKDVEVRDLPYGISSRNAVSEMEHSDCILIHHHVEPLVALRIAMKYGPKTCMYVGELTRAIWERQLTGGDYRQFSPSVFQTARHFYGPASTLALLGPIYNFTTAMLRVLDRMTIMRCGMVIANSNYTAETTRRLLGYSGPIPVVYPASGIPSSMFRPDYENGEYVLAVGALQPNKNHQVLFRALSTLDDPPPMCLIGDGQEAGHLRDLAKKLSLSVKFFPRVGDEALCRLYEKSLFVTVSSLSEPFGMTPVEGALAGKPSVVGTVGGTREFVIDGETGLVVNSTSPRHMAGALQMLLSDRDLRKTMGQRARERALSHFTLDSSVTSLTEALDILA
jgi:glycosyltransferase involved in cell wall biosynthesis